MSGLFGFSFGEDPFKFLMSNAAGNGNWRERLVKQVSSSPVSSGEAAAVVQAVNLADTWLNEVTSMPSGVKEIEAWSPKQWAENADWERYYQAFSSDMLGSSLLEQAPIELPENILKFISQIGMGQFTAQFVDGAKDLATETVSGCDYGLPLVPAGQVVLLPKGTNQEQLLQAACREAARHRLYAAAPWLHEQILTSIEEIAASIGVDNERMQQSMEEWQRDIQEQFESGGGFGFPGGGMSFGFPTNEKEFMVVNDQAALNRFLAIIAAAEGWVEYVTEQALGSRLDPATSKWRERITTGGNASNVLTTLFGGGDWPQPPIEAAVKFWAKVDNAVGATERDAVFSHPDFLPTLDDLTAPADFIDGLLTMGDAEYDPIAEITRLEAEGNPAPPEKLPEDDQ